MKIMLIQIPVMKGFLKEAYGRILCLYHNDRNLMCQSLLLKIYDLRFNFLFKELKLLMDKQMMT